MVTSGEETQGQDRSGVGARSMRGRFGVGLGMVWIDQGRFWESFGGVPGAQLKSLSTRRHNFMRKCQTMFSQKSTKVQCQNRKQVGSS